MKATIYYKDGFVQELEGHTIKILPPDRQPNVCGITARDTNGHLRDARIFTVTKIDYIKLHE